ncbi:MAG TPA: hypothetical protein VFT64_07680 [Rickettsiales bacterium]|nr:hypothetical protein [Rickettsiales bacterium]
MAYAKWAAGICLLAAASANAADYCAPSHALKAVADTELNSIFAHQYGPGWIGGDSTYSTLLPDGRVAFSFSDSFIGTAKPDGTASLAGMLHNTELVGKLPKLASYYGGSYAKPEALIPNAHRGKWFWTFATYYENGSQLIFINEFDNQNPFGNFTGISGIAGMQVSKDSAPHLSKLTLQPSRVMWGMATVQDDAYHYIYGRAMDATFGKMKLARVPLGKSDIFSVWEYWNGKKWTRDVGQAVTIDTGHELDGVMRQPTWMGKGYLAVSIPAGVFVDNELDVSFACAPQGPWSKPVAVYRLPEVAGPLAYKDEIAYLPTVHPELDGEGYIVASYNINTTDGLQAYAHNMHIYQPRFVRIGY